MDTRTWKRWCVIACVAFVCVTKDKTTEALYCYSCTWGYDEEDCKTNREMVEKIGGKGTVVNPSFDECFTRFQVPTKEDFELSCNVKRCENPKPACIALSNPSTGSKFFKGRRNIVYGCCDDPIRRRMSFTWGYAPAFQDQESQGFFCTEDFCNGEVYVSSVSPIFLLTASTAAILVLSVLIPFCYSPLLMRNE